MPVTYNYTHSESPPAPYVLASIARPDGSAIAVDVPAKVDSGADRTVIPNTLAEQLALDPIEQREFEGLGGHRITLSLYELRITVRGCPTVSVIAASSDGEPYTLLGRDVLNCFNMTLDGPNLKLVIS